MHNKVLANILIVGDPRQSGTPLLQAASVRAYQTEILSAKNIQNAIKIAIIKPIDLVIIDYYLEDGSAVEFLEALHYLSFKIIPTIVLSAESDEKIAIHAFRKGAKEFLFKDHNGSYLQRLPLMIERILKDENHYRKNILTKRDSDAILSTVSDGIVGISLNKLITFANPAAAMYLNTSFENLMGNDVTQYLSGLNGFADALIQAIEKVQLSNHTSLVGIYDMESEPTKQAYKVKISVTPVFDNLMHLDGYVLTLCDISTQATLQRDESGALYDDLTGLYNLKAFMRRLDHTLAYCERYKTKCGVLFINIDGFKTINDVLGHQNGDKILIKVAKRIQSVIREADVIARIRGNEFAVLLAHINHTNDASKVAIKINRALLPPFELEDQEYYMSVSIGIALYPNDSTEAEELLQYADDAMSLAKKKGKNHYQYYTADLNIEAERNMRISNDLRLAIVKNELELFYHPQINATDGLLTGVEALLRWRHPVLGMISPAVFIPIAEEMGFIASIGQWVLAKACEHCILWKNLGLEDFSISINVSIKELFRDNFVEDIAECTYRFQIESHRIRFEITESIFAHDTLAIIHKLHQLKSLGFKIAMDDFGTGYSCLSYLKDLPIDIIKIDRSFIEPLNNKPTSRHKAIIASIIDLSKKLEISTLAEGVETPLQAEYLTALGCEHLQGFLIAKPLPFDEVTEFIKRYLPNRLIDKKSAV